jgi:hypothetical protein
VWAAVAIGDRAAARDRLGRLEVAFDQEQDPMVAVGIARWVVDGATYATGARRSRWSRVHDELSDEAIAILERLIANLRARPGIDTAVVTVEALMSLASALGRTGRLRQATDRHQEVFDLTPGENQQLARTVVRTQPSVSDRYINAVFVRAVAHLKAGEPADALHMMDDLLAFLRGQSGRHAKSAFVVMRGARVWMSHSTGWTDEAPAQDARSS